MKKAHDNFPKPKVTTIDSFDQPIVQKILNYHKW